MPLDEHLIAEACERYFRERERYVKLAIAVDDKVRRIVAHLGVRATVQNRAKSMESFRGKLLRFQASGSKDHLVNSVDDVFAVVGDLAAVRILPYLEADRDRIVARIVSEFVNADGNAVGDSPGDIERKPDPEGNYGKSSRHYRATHCRVYLPPNELKGPYENLAGTPCEVQVCSILAHAWNEIEHDLGYKPGGGELSQVERQCLDELADLTIQGDAVIIRLIRAAEEKLADLEGDFADEHDFVLRVQRPVNLPARSAVEPRELYHAMLGCGLRKPGDIDFQLIDEGWKQRSESVIRQLNIVLTHLGREYRLHEDDRLLALFLDYFAEQVIKSWPMQRRMPKRIVELAGIMQQIKDEKYRKVLDD